MRAWLQRLFSLFVRQSDPTVVDPTSHHFGMGACVPPSYPVHHDYRVGKLGWGHDYRFAPEREDPNRARMSGWGSYVVLERPTGGKATTIRRGDFILVTGPAHMGIIRYRVEKVDYHRTDMWTATVVLDLTTLPLPGEEP